MITLNNVKFAESENEMIDSLFSNNGTCSGYAKRLTDKIQLRNLQKELIGVINQCGVLVKATKVEKGYWYSYADIELLGEYDSCLQFEEISKLYIRTEIGGKRVYK
ncbi:MAG: hypothetical protein RR959_08305 [Erysipelotrichaceae bacterium]